MTNNGEGDRVIWKKLLANTPHHVLVSNDGEVITVDAYAQLGYKHALVFYGREGTLLKDYELNQLLTNDEIREFVVQSVSSRHWAKEAQFQFDAPRHQFVVSMKWGKIIRFELANGNRADAPLADDNNPIPENLERPFDSGYILVISLTTISSLLVVVGVAYLLWRRR